MSHYRRKMTTRLPCVRILPAIKKRRAVLREDIFVKYVIHKGLTREQLRKNFGVSYNTLNTSLEYYKDKYAAGLRRLKHERYALAMKGNQRGHKDRPATTLPREKLETMLKRGYGLYELATELKTSAWFVRENIRRYGLKMNKKLPYKMQDIDLDFLQRLKALVPGIRDAAENYYNDPHRFFTQLHLCFVRLNELVWFVHSFKKPHAHFIAKGHIPRDHINWSSNRAEMRLSMGLLDAEIPHQREIVVAKKYIVDFLFPAERLIVEVDGAFHRRDTPTQRRDKRKTTALHRNGFRLLRVTDDEVYKNLPDVVQRVKQALLKK